MTKIECPSCEMKTASAKWNAETLIYMKKHYKKANLTTIQKAIRSDINNLRYICPRCEEMVFIEDIKEVNENDQS